MKKSKQHQTKEDNQNFNPPPNKLVEEGCPPKIEAEVCCVFVVPKPLPIIHKYIV